MLSERHARTIWNFSGTSHGKGPVAGIQAILKWTAADKIKQSKTAAKLTIQLFKHSTINITSLLTDVLQNHVENLGLQKLFKRVNKTPDITKYHHNELKD